MISSKIIVGLAQFTNEYEKFNNKKKTNKDFKKLFNFLIKKKFFYFDNAIDYKNVDKKFKNTNNINIKVITKFSIPKNVNKNYSNIIIDNLKKSLTTFGLRKFESVLIHNPWVLNKKNHNLVSSIFEDIKKQNIAKMIGVSVYTLREYYNFRKYFIPSVVQIPFNLFNTQFNNKTFIKDIKKNNIEVHARSIFLKGMLIQPKKLFFKKKILIKEILKVENFLLKEGISKIDFLINFVLSHNFINKLVIGFNSESEVKEILEIKKKKIDVHKFRFALPKKIIDPRLWKI